MDQKDCKIPCPKQIGSYEILSRIAIGGMGEVYLAYDPLCKRKVAVKKIRGDLLNHPTLKERFLKEAKIAAQLSHPYIIPIYGIHQDCEEIYYTMPVAEGETLKAILKQAKGQDSSPGTSIPYLMRIFFNICQAIAYSHSKGILHRDLKPENIIVGKFGEVLILDWGLAEYVDAKPESCPIETLEESDPDLTRPGKVAGTLAYLSPERILGAQASFSSDIYALGVILYQLLTLHYPFHRKSAKNYRKMMKYEHLVDPAERSPYRDIPPQLSKIVKKCLACKKEKRYASLEALLEDLNNYLEGKAEWSPSATLCVDSKQDWEFQENILLAKHIALTQKTDLMEWVNLMICKDPFPGNIKIETHVRITESSRGIGFLLNVKPKEERKDHFHEGFFLWIGSEQEPGCHLFRSNMELMANPNLSLKNTLSHSIRIEKMDYHLRCYMDNILIFDYLSHTPFCGPHFGVILKDGDLDVGTLLISTSSPNMMVSCLAVPDAFLAKRHYTQALTEYRQIARSFPGRAEGREALFRSGITLIEEAQSQKKARRQKELLQQALEEFTLLRHTPGAPLEYLGKSLVYKATREIEEEVKCLELAIRKHEKHPLFSLLSDQVLFRLHEASYKDRVAAYHFALLTLRYLPERFSKKEDLTLLENVENNWEGLSFIQKEATGSNLSLAYIQLCIQLSFWLAKPMALVEIAEQTLSQIQTANALFCLLQLGCHDAVRQNLSLLHDAPEELTAFSLLFESIESGTLPSIDLFTSFSTKRVLFYLMEQAYYLPSCSFFPRLKKISEASLNLEDRLAFEKRYIWLLLLAEKWDEAKSRLHSLFQTPYEETSPFYFLHVCLTVAKEGSPVALGLLSRHSETVSPPSYLLIDHYLHGKISLKTGWVDTAFFWEKMELLRQLALFYHCAKLKPELQKTLKQIRKEYTKIYGSYSHP